MVTPGEDTAGNGIGDVNDPFVLFHEWLAEAGKGEPADPNAMALATVDEDGLPNVRMVLLKDADARGFVFYTNLESAKGGELLAAQKAALCFHWKSQHRQIRIRGPVEKVGDEEADAYFASRPRGSRIGAWASKQSRPLQGRFELEREVAKYATKYAVGSVPRPPYWSGFRIAPVEMEFWRAGAFRLHDRLVFRRSTPHDPWTQQRLYP